MATRIIDVGGQDPSERNSPIAPQDDVEMLYLRQESPGDAVCYFNDVPYEHGTLVKSGTVVLRCDRGLWIEAGPSDPDNP